MTSDNGNPFREDRMYTVSDLVDTLQISRVTIHRREKTGELPKPIELPAVGKRWAGRHLIAWYDQQTGKSL